MFKKADIFFPKPDDEWSLNDHFAKETAPIFDDGAADNGGSERGDASGSTPKKQKTNTDEPIVSIALRKRIEELQGQGKSGSTPSGAPSATKSQGVRVALLVIFAAIKCIR